MSTYRCLIVEDDWFAIEMMAGYVGRRSDLELAGIVQQLDELPDALITAEPDIVFLDLIIPQGAPSGFHFGLIPASVTVVIVSAIPVHAFHGILPQGIVAELLKPLSYENFDTCIDWITKRLNQK